MVLNGAEYFALLQYLISFEIIGGGGKGGYIQSSTLNS
jgi:thioredoxin reductase